MAAEDFVQPYLEAFGLPQNWLPWIGPVTAVMDISLALAILLHWRVKLIGVLQLTLVGSYSLGISFANPEIWLDPFGSILKNLPVIVLILVWMALEDER